MQEDIYALSQKYKEEMLRLYGGKTAPVQGNPVPPPPDEPAMPEPPYEENPVLPDYIMRPEPAPSPAPPPMPEPPPRPEPLPPPMPDSVPENFTSEGKLQVVAASGTSARPVPDAVVTISRKDGSRSHLVRLLTTDDSGKTPVVTLPAPSAALSQEPGNAQPYALYDIAIFANGYFREVAEDAPVFAGITSRQVFQMIPLPLHVHEDVETIRYPGSPMEL